MGRRHRQRDRLTAPASDYPDAEGNVLTLRGSLTPASRREYLALLQGGLHRGDSEQRALEFLFERLALAWTIAGVRTEAQKALLGRYRMASGQERQFVRETIREHVRAHFSELPAP